MNFIQFGLFFIFSCSAFCAGVAVQTWISRGEKGVMLNRPTYLGETLLLGSMVIVAGMMSLSLVGLYKISLLWGWVVAQFFFLLFSRVRLALMRFLALPAWDKKIIWAAPALLFVLLLVIFTFRNCFFKMDIDSHSYYLLAQKFWLAHSSSVGGDVSIDSRIFSPSFNAVPYALGIGIFPHETLFAQLIDLFWRGIVLLLVFGYAAYRFNGYYGLGAACLICFNDHFFYSGVNKAVVINGAIIAMLFAAAYNFWEARRKNSHFYFTLGLIFATHFLANKYQFFYVLIFLLAMALLIMPEPIKMVRQTWNDKISLGAVGTAALMAAVWPLKNYLATGDPSFPILAGRFHLFNWTPDMHKAWAEASGILPLSLCLKYISYMFVWPGVNALKFVFLMLLSLPFVFVLKDRRGPAGPEDTKELGYWLGLTLLALVGTCLIGFSDPRNYQYLVAVAAFGVIYFVHYFFRFCLGINRPWVIGAVIMAMSLLQCRAVFGQGGSLGRPTFQDNIDVLLDRIHTWDVIDRYYPYQKSATEGFKAHEQTAARSAWGGPFARKYSAFMSEIRPQVNHWSTTIVHWDSFPDKTQIARDLRNFGIEYVMVPTETELKFFTPEEYAGELAQFERYPERILYDYGFPDELSVIKR